jgi:Haem-binding domain
VAFGKFSTAAAGLALLLAAQLVPAGHTNPPSPGTLSAPPPIRKVLQSACYDCHSNETRWPWYSYVAPLSWRIARDVTLGRKEVNFSEWRSYLPATRRRKLEWVGRVLRTEQMPPWSYRLMHPAARLTPEDRAMLERWIQTAVANAIPERSAH